MHMALPRAGAEGRGKGGGKKRTLSRRQLTLPKEKKGEKRERREGDLRLAFTIA